MSGIGSSSNKKDNTLEKGTIAMSSNVGQEGGSTLAQILQHTAHGAV